MTTLPADVFQPLANYVLVAVPERFIDHYKTGEKRIIMPGGDDNYQELYQALLNGENCHIEEDPNAHRTPVSTGQVLAVPRQLTADMILCAGLGQMQVPRLEGVNTPDGKPVKNRDGSRAFRENGWQVADRPKTCADIQNPVEVGDIVHFEHHYLTDEAEVMPGVYLLPYTALVAVIEGAEAMPSGGYHRHLRGDKVVYSMVSDFDLATKYSPRHPTVIRPIGGYILLSRVWADDVTDETGAEGGLMKCRKSAAGLVLETNVPPLENEGVVAWIDAPLKGLRGADEVKVGQRLIIDGRHALIETIAGTEYICIRQEHCLGEREVNRKATSGKGLMSSRTKGAVFADHIESGLIIPYSQPVPAAPVTVKDMTPQQEKMALSHLADYAERCNWHPKFETPLFVSIDGRREGPFLNRGNRLLPISLRAAWAMLCAAASFINGKAIYWGTYAEREPTADLIYQRGDLLRL